MYTFSSAFFKPQSECKVTTFFYTYLIICLLIARITLIINII